MNTFSNKTLVFVLALLLLGNLIFVGLLFFNREPGKKVSAERRGPLTTYVKNDIGFSETQMMAFDSIKAQHKKQVGKWFDDIRNEKMDVYRKLGSMQFSDSAIAEAARFAAQKQESMEKMMLTNIKDIRNICTPEQMQKFDTGFYKVMVRGAKDSSRTYKK